MEQSNSFIPLTINSKGCKNCNYLAFEKVDGGYNLSCGILIVSKGAELFEVLETDGDLNPTKLKPVILAGNYDQVKHSCNTPVKKKRLNYKRYCCSFV